MRMPDQTMFFENEGRIIVWYSDGAASAVAAKFAVEKYGKSGRELRVIKCDTTQDESDDNLRFRHDVEAWIGWKVELIRSDDFKTVDEVIEKTRYMSGPNGARCTTELKKIPRFKFQKWNDVHIFGLTADEIDRIQDFEGNNPELILEWNLLERGYTKDMCLHDVGATGIELPLKYRQGYKNNNCHGCLKATSAKYWNLVRKTNPDVFQRRCMGAENPRAQEIDEAIAGESAEEIESEREGMIVMGLIAARAACQHANWYEYDGMYLCIDCKREWHAYPHPEMIDGIFVDHPADEIPAHMKSTAKRKAP